VQAVTREGQAEQAKRMHDGTTGDTAMLRITGRTRILFILADPVAHVMGSAYFNDWFAAHGVDAAVSPLHVAPDDLGSVVNAIRRMRNVAGFGVTIPHKIAVRGFIDEASERAQLVGAINFVRRGDDGRLTGDNIDGVGFLAGLARNGVDVAGKRVLQLGAGGAGRAIAFALAGAGASRLVIANRSREKAHALAAAVRAAVPACACVAGEADPRGMNLVVNTTSVGLRSDLSPLPDPAVLEPGIAVADIIMAPETTRLLTDALARGCRIVRGRDMLEGQIALCARFMDLAPSANSP
jgi:shikimate dehydrogenase